MEQIILSKPEERICILCKSPLGEKVHGNRKFHPKCGYEYKKQRQKRKYQVGNSAKIRIQKNENVASMLYDLDKEKKGIPFTVAMEMGLKFNCPATIFMHGETKVYMFDKLGYSIEEIKGETLIFIHHDTEFV